jgi:hypothetical protein
LVSLASSGRKVHLSVRYLYAREPGSVRIYAIFKDNYRRFNEDESRKYLQGKNYAQTHLNKQVSIFKRDDQIGKKDSKSVG